MRKPDFFLVGAAKAGTTSIFDYLTQHASIFVPSMKEPHFFSDFPHPHAPQLAGNEDYLALFRKCEDGQIAGDLSTSYLCSPNAAWRIHDLQPDAKIIIILRNPVDRAYSFYWYNQNRFVETLSFEEALDAEPQRIAEGANFRFHYVESGKYHDQVERYLRIFGPHSVRVYLFEDLKRDATSLSRDIFSFLGVPADVTLRTDGVFNQSGVYRSEAIGRALMMRMPGERLIRSLVPGAARRLRARLIAYNMRRPPAIARSTRARLTEAFRDDIDRLGRLLGRDLSHWTAASTAGGSLGRQRQAGGTVGSAN